MTDDLALWLSISAGALAILYGVVSAKWIVNQSAGNEKMQQIAGFIQEGANAYMNRQYRTIGIVGIVLFVPLSVFLGLATGIGFAIGAIFGRYGEKVSLGFVEETEKQVVVHLDKHLNKISSKDKETIEILQTMRADEDAHAQQAVENGGEELEIPTKKIMKYTAKVMTSTSAHI